MIVTMEVCVDCIESAVKAEEGGAKRVELCANLLEGGTTPSAGKVKRMKKEVKIPVFVMIRPRGGDFLYSNAEMDIMKEDITCLKEAGADGFVFGILTKNGDIDKERCAELLELTEQFPATFHRAIDMSRDLMTSLDDIIDLGFDRVLTSGGQSNAQDGSQVIADMVAKADGRIVVVPGGGIKENNLVDILKRSGALEFHGSARETLQSSMVFRKNNISMGSVPGTEYAHKVTSVTMVNSLVKKAENVWQCTNE